jgi:hypothetical protein
MNVEKVKQVQSKIFKILHGMIEDVKETQKIIIEENRKIIIEIARSLGFFH